MTNHLLSQHIWENIRLSILDNGHFHVSRTQNHSKDPQISRITNYVTLRKGNFLVIIVIKHLEEQNTWKLTKWPILKDTNKAFHLVNAAINHLQADWRLVQQIGCFVKVETETNFKWKTTNVPVVYLYVCCENFCDHRFSEIAGGGKWAKMGEKLHRSPLYVQLLAQTEKAQSVTPQTTKYRYRTVI